MQGNQDFLSVFLNSWLPFIVLIVVYTYFMRTMKKKGFVSAASDSIAQQLEGINMTLKEISQKLDK